MPKIALIPTALVKDTVAHHFQPINGQSGAQPAVFRDILTGNSVSSQPELRARLLANDKRVILAVTGQKPVFRTTDGVDVVAKKPIRVRFECEAEPGTPDSDIDDAIKLFWPALYSDVLVGAMKTGTPIVN